MKHKVDISVLPHVIKVVMGFLRAKCNHLCIVSTFIITFIFRQFKTAEDVPAPYKSDTNVLLGNKSLFTYFHF